MEQVTQQVAGANITGWDVIWAVVVLVVAWLGSRWARRLTRRLLESIGSVPDELKVVVVRISGWFVILFGVAWAISLLADNSTPLLFMVIILVGIAALSLKTVAENLGAAVIIQSRSTVRPGDLISTVGYTGEVDEVNGRSVVIKTFDGRQVHLPNTKVLEGPLENRTSLGSLRSELYVRLGHGVDYEKSIEMVGETVRSCDEVLTEPSPTVRATAGDSGGILLAVRFWHGPEDGGAAAAAVVAALVSELEPLGEFRVGPLEWMRPVSLAKPH